MSDTMRAFDELSLGAPENIQVPAGVSSEVADAVRALYSDGTVGKKGAFSRVWATEMAEDIYVAFQKALSRKGGAMGCRPPPLLRGDPSGAASRLARPRRPPLGS